MNRVDRENYRKYPILQLSGKDGLIVVKNREIHVRATGRMRKDVYPLAGAEARVETCGDIERRVTATRVALAGPFALAMKKARDHRQLFLTIDGPGYQVVIEVDPGKDAKARKFATQLTNQSRSLAAEASVSGVTSPSPAIMDLQPSANAVVSSLAPPPSAPAGWYADPTGQLILRYFDGQAWTEHTAPVPR